MTGTAPVGARRTGWGTDALRIGFGLVWAVDAGLKWLPGFRNSFGQTLSGLAAGQPGWLKPWFNLWDGMGHTEALVLAYLVALTETYIAVAVISGFARKVTYITAAVYSLMIWAIPEAFGGPYTSGATDIGTGIIYTVVFIGLLILSANTGTDRHSVDFYLESRIPWWWRVAEMRRPNPAVVDVRERDRAERRPSVYISVGRQPDA
jgi:uncharacterized membrane protein YphA (DoxX/SURF4 family)